MKKYFFLSHRDAHMGKRMYLINYGLVLTLLAGFFFLSFASFAFNLQWGSVWNYRILLLKGFVNTIIIAGFSLICSIMLGILLVVGSNTRVMSLRALSRLYVEIIRGTPFMVQIMIFYYVVANALGFTNKYLSGVIILSIFSSAYVAEIFRSSIQSIDSTQMETAVSLGFTSSQIFRYIMLPQLIRQVIPPLTGQLVSLVKDSSLLSIISIREFTMAAREVNSATFSTLEIYIPLALGYLLLTYPISFFSRRMERKFKYET